MYVCIYVYMHICMYVCMCVYICVDFIRRFQNFYFNNFLNVMGPLHLAKFAIANIGQVLVQVLTQYLVQVFHFSGFSFCEKLFFHSSYAVLTCT